ncbi:MAG: PAS domain-containing sensor histidine kinase [Deltaproteobacteria bacterium]|nr:PAS domain-containing sensor histidine kinase [Deltaproteobacteria bacterium]
MLPVVDLSGASGVAASGGGAYGDSPVASRLPDGVYRLLFEYASDAVLSVRLATLRIESANRRIEEMTGYALNDLVGTTVTRLFPQGDGQACDTADFDAGVLDMPGLHDDLRLRGADGHSRFLSVAVAHVPDDAGALAACVLRDTTERRLLEREVITKHMALRQAHEELLRVSRDLEGRNGELARMSRRVAALTRQAAIGAFTAGVAHGINNPLAALISNCRQMTKITTEFPRDASSQRLLELLTRQQDAAARIKRLIEDMRKAHRGGGTEPKQAALNLSEEIDAALLMFEHRVGAIRVERRYAPIPRLEGNPDELQHLFANLIDNALLAMGDAGTLVVTTAVAAGVIRATVEDTGPGLPQEVLARLFEPFVTMRPDGTGLGLCTAHRLAHSHGGRLSAEAVSPKGTRFVLELPIPAAPVPTPAEHGRHR